MTQLRVIRGCRECPFFVAWGDELDCTFDGIENSRPIEEALVDSGLPESVRDDIAHDLSRVDHGVPCTTWFSEPWMPSSCPLLTDNVVFTAVRNVEDP